MLDANYVPARVITVLASLHGRLFLEDGEIM